MHKTAWFTLFLHCIAKPLRLARRVEGLPSWTAGDALDAAGLALLSKVHRPCNIVGEQLVRTASEFAGMGGNRVAAEITWKRRSHEEICEFPMHFDAAGATGLAILNRLDYTNLRPLAHSGIARFLQ
jgi:hypothetical protein